LRPDAGWVTFRERAEAALREGWNSAIGDRNPYAGGDSLALAKCWMRGHMTMLTIRSAATPAMQRYLQGRGRIRRWRAPT
jgi:hypothetical protein